MKPEPIIFIVTGIIVLVKPDIIQWVLGISLILMGVLGLAGKK